MESGLKTFLRIYKKYKGLELSLGCFDALDVYAHQKFWAGNTQTWTLFENLILF